MRHTVTAVSVHRV